MPRLPELLRRASRPKVAEEAVPETAALANKYLDVYTQRLITTVFPAQNLEVETVATTEMTAGQQEIFAAIGEALKDSTLPHVRIIYTPWIDGTVSYPPLFSRPVPQQGTVLGGLIQNNLFATTIAFSDEVEGLKNSRELVADFIRQGVQATRESIIGLVSGQF